MSMTVDLKLCVSCATEKSVEDFPWADKKRGFRRRSCRECYSKIKRLTAARYRSENREAINEAGRAYHDENRDKRNAARMQRYHEMSAVEKHRRRAVQKYAITVEQYNEMLSRQDERCAICREEETRTRQGTLRTLCVDHDHVTGVVRGLLCASCNSGIAYLADNVERLGAAIDYLSCAPAHLVEKEL